jgi:hypothetical protein
MYQMCILSSRGETSNHIITNQFTGYMAYTDKKFVEYIEKCKDRYEEGEDVTYLGIMSKAERKLPSQSNEL